MVHASRLLVRPSAYSDGSKGVPNALGHITRAELLASIGIDVTEVLDDHMRLLKRARAPTMKAPAAVGAAYETHPVPEDTAT